MNNETHCQISWVNTCGKNTCRESKRRNLEKWPSYQLTFYLSYMDSRLLFLSNETGKDGLFIF